MDLNIRDGENELQYIWRTAEYVKDGKITWKGLADEINTRWRDPVGEPHRCESSYRKAINAAKAYKAKVFDKMDSGSYANSLDEKKRELEKERKKLQTEKLEYNRWLRENARDEMITEQIVNAVRSLEPLTIPETRIVKENTAKEGILVLSDCHYGVEFDIKGLFGETLNAYSPEIFEQRMWYLFNKVCDIVEKEQLDTIHIWECGDSIDSILRLTSQLMKLRYGILESTVKYANFLAEWLNRLSEKVNIKLQIVKRSNHCQLRICGAPKNAFPDEDMSVVITEIIKSRLENNPNIEIIENPTGYPFQLICGEYNVLAIHGEVKDLGKAIDDFGRSYKMPIDYLIGGHKHHRENIETGIDCEAISVGSIIGVDSYGLSLNKTSNASATFLVFEEGLGKSVQYDIKL